MLPKIREIYDFLREEVCLCRLEQAGEKKRTKEARKSLIHEGKGPKHQPPTRAATQWSRGTFQHELDAKRTHPDVETRAWGASKIRKNYDTSPESTLKS